MHDHVRVVGGLYIGWAAVQAALAAVLWALHDELQPRGGLLFTASGLAAALVLAFAVVGALLWRHDRRARSPAIALAAVALLSFPAGTALGAYALWALLRRPHEARADA